MYWRDRTLIDRADALIVGGKPTGVKYAAFELSIGREVFITGEKVKRRVNWNDQIVIPPGQMALLLTQEHVIVPTNALGFLSMKSRYKLKGLVNVSGFHVDPGFYGNLIFAVYNASPAEIRVTVGKPIFMLWYCDLDGHAEKPYGGDHAGQQEIPDHMVDDLQAKISSPADLQRQIDDVRAGLHRTRWYAGLIGVTLGIFFSGILTPFFQRGMTSLLRWLFSNG